MTCRILNLLMLLAVFSAANAQSVDDDTWHDVQPGETMSTIARLYYGPDASWRMVAAQNPSIPNPQSLVPGMRLRIDPAFRLPAPSPSPSPRQVSEPTVAPSPEPPATEPRQTIPEQAAPGQASPTAGEPVAPTSPATTPTEKEGVATPDAIEVVIDEITNQVDKNIARAGWEEALERERLRIGDGLRTLSASSARLTVDGATIALTEFTQFFVREDAPVNGVPQDRRIDLERGEFVIDIPDAATSGVRIGIGDSRLVLAPGSGPASYRVRKTKLGGLKVMVYAGNVRVTGNNDPVEIGAGFGAAIEAGDAPGAPVPLLQPPVLVSPAAGSTLPPSNIAFEWQYRDGALNYRVEICSDPDCNQLVRRKLDHVDTRWLTGSLGAGDYFWRVVTINPVGLDGFAGESIPFKVGDTGGADAPTVPLLPLALIVGLVLLAIMLVAFLWPRPKRHRR